MKKKFAWKKHLVVMFLTIIIFLFGLLIGNYSSSQKLQDMRLLQDDLRTQTLDAETHYALVQNAPCTFNATEPLIEELYALSIRLDFMENVLGPDDERVVSMKEYYSLLQLRHWLFLNSYQRQCGTNLTTIIYFYSNEKGECPKCEEQGFILTWLRKNYPEVQIFSFDKNLNLTTLNTLRRTYGVEEVPFIAIDGKVYPGFQTQNALLLALLNDTQPVDAQKAVVNISSSLDEVADSDRATV